MERVVFKFSDFFEDDGAFEAAERKIQQFGESIVDQAKRIRTAFSRNLDLDNAGNIADFEEQVEQLTKSFEDNQKAQSDLNKIRQAAIRINKTMNQGQEQQIERLVELDKQLIAQRSNLKEINTLSRNNIRTDRDLNKERVQAQIAIKEIQQEQRALQREITRGNRLSRQEEKLIQARITLRKEEVTTLAEVRARISALRTVVQSLNLEEDAEQIAAYNREINELTSSLSDNSDEFIQSKINIGNYEESIVNALNQTNAFSTGIGILDNGISQLIGALALNNNQLRAMEAQLDANSSAVQRLTVGVARLNRTARAGIIGIIVIALSALASAFGDTRAGAIRLEQAMSTLSTAFTIFTQNAREALSGIGRALAEFFTNPLTGAGRAATILEETFNNIARNAANASEAVVAGLENIERAFQIEDEVRRLNQEIARLEGTLAILQGTADDSTRSLRTQLQANQDALRVAEQIAERNVTVARRQLEIANERVKQNILANGVEASNIDLSQQGVAFANATLDLAQRRGSQLEISNSLIEQQQNAVLEVTRAENEQAETLRSNQERRRQIQRDLFEQDLDLLIDLIDTEKNLSEEFVNDVTRTFQNRVTEFNRFLVKFRMNAQSELDLFTQQARNLDLDLDFQAQFDEDGNLSVFVNDTQLALDNVVLLNKQLQATGLGEIEINRFREFVIETRNGVRDFRALNTELVNAGINFRQLQAEFEIGESELQGLRNLETEIKAIQEALTGTLSASRRAELVKQLEELEERRTEISKQADRERTEARIGAITAELATVERGSQREIELLNERLALEKKLIDESNQEKIKAEIETQNKIIEENKKAERELRAIIGRVLDAAVRAQERQVTMAEEASERQAQAVERQQERARLGLANTLAFEQRELAAREAQRIQEERRRERIERIRALYSAYNNYASQGDGQDALSRALRDFAILEAVSASFGDGGIVGIDGYINSKGITKGGSHAMGTDVVAKFEGGEGFFSRKEVSNMGHDNFRTIKSMAANGMIDKDFFSKQRSDLVTAMVPMPVRNDDRLINELQEVKRAIVNKPVTQWDFAESTHDTIKMIEKVSSNNKVKRNVHIIKKPRL